VWAAAAGSVRLREDQSANVIDRRLAGHWTVAIGFVEKTAGLRGKLRQNLRTP